MAKLKRPTPEPGPAVVSTDPTPAAPRRDPRWALVPRARLTPAMMFHLLTGEPADVRIRGWVAHAQAGTRDEPDVDMVWAAHQHELVTLARTHGFEPARLTGHKPSGEAFEAWRAAFVAEHRY